MGRPRNDKQMTSLSIRVAQEERDRLEAALFYAGGASRPSELNLSQGVREVLNQWLEAFEDASGGEEALSVNFSRARIKEQSEALEQLQRAASELGRADSYSSNGP